MAAWSPCSSPFTSPHAISCSLPPSPPFCIPCPRPPRSSPQPARTFIVRNVAGIPKRSVNDGTAADFQRNLLERSDTTAKISSGHEGNSLPSSYVPPSSVEGGQVQEGSGAGDPEDFDLETGFRMSRVCDRLIEVFMIEKTKPDEWRKLLAFSQEWRKIRPHFFKRCKSAADQETDAKRKGDLLQLSRKLKEVDDDMERHNELLAYVKEHEFELDTVIANRRKDFTNDFFHHLELLCQAAYDRADHRDDLARLAAKCLAAVEAHDRAAEDDVAISIAQQKFNDILNSPSLEAACNKIDQLAKKKKAGFHSDAAYHKGMGSFKRIKHDEGRGQRYNVPPLYGSSREHAKAGTKRGSHHEAYLEF